MTTYTEWKRTSPAYRAYRNATIKCRRAFANIVPAATASAKTETVKNTSVPMPKLGKWTHPGNGEIRYYVNNLAELVGLETGHYNTGNISGAWLNGEIISNSEGRRIHDMCYYGKVWVHTDGTLGYKAISGTRELSAQDVFDRVNNALAVHGLREDIRKGLI